MQQLQAGNFRGSPAALSSFSRTCAGLWSELRHPPTQAPGSPARTPKDGGLEQRVAAFALPCALGNSSCGPSVTQSIGFAGRGRYCWVRLGLVARGHVQRPMAARPRRPDALQLHSV
jgi:hypothetical protein